LRRFPDGIPPLEAEAARHINVAKQSLVHLVNRLPNSCARSAVRAVLYDPVVFVDGPHELAPLPQFVGAGFFDVSVFARLAGPDTLERMLVVGVAMETASIDLSSSSLR